MPVTFGLWKSSCAKWDKNLWDRLVDAEEKQTAIEKFIPDRSWTFKSMLWNTCGYCVRYTLTCDECSLQKDNICGQTLILLPESSPIKRMLETFERDEKDKFEIARKELQEIFLKTKFQDPR